MKKSEALEKLCPLAMNGIGTTCQGSGCMGWDAFRVFMPNPGFDPDRASTTNNDENHWVAQDPPQGNCGMKPKEIG